MASFAAHWFLPIFILMLIFRLDCGILNLYFFLKSSVFGFGFCFHLCGTDAGTGAGTDVGAGAGTDDGSYWCRY